MNPEQIQQAIEGMLSIQRELQNSQLRFEAELGDLKQSVSELKETQKQTLTQTLVAMDALLENGKATDRRIEQLIGYSITQESDVLDVRADVLNLKRRVTALEQKPD